MSPSRSSVSSEFLRGDGGDLTFGSDQIEKRTFDEVAAVRSFHENFASDTGKKEKFTNFGNGEGKRPSSYDVPVAPLIYRIPGTSYGFPDLV